MRVFITATGTDVGKTYVAAGLLRHLRTIGIHAQPLKPVMSGYDPAALHNSDAALLLAASGRNADARAIAAISPWCYTAALSPEMAAAREGRRVDFRGLVAFCERDPATDLVIEGAGGVMVPLDAQHTVLDWMAALDMPALVVCGSYLGTISHTLTALGMMRARGIRVAACVVNQTPGSTVDHDATTEAIARHGAVTAIPLHRDAAATEGYARIVDAIRARQ